MLPQEHQSFPQVSREAVLQVIKEATSDIVAQAFIEESPPEGYHLSRPIDNLDDARSFFAERVLEVAGRSRGLNNILECRECQTRM